MTSHDVIVLGAGPAGSAAAIGFARQGRSVALIEKAEFPRRKVCGEFMSATSIPVLRELGVDEAWRAAAGPEVRRVALFAGACRAVAPMPSRHGFGRALGRDVLDTILRDAAQHEGVEIHQPCRATAISRMDGAHAVTIADAAGTVAMLRAPVLVAANGSWGHGGLPTDPPKRSEPSDMLGFKAHFRGATLDADTMPLLAFPGGYGGLVWADDGRLSLSCCLRRDAVTALRQRRAGSAAEVVAAHLAASCRGVREVLAEAEAPEPWLATGPIRPGIRPRYADDVFRAGNLAGEAHPVVAEGISMAIQSSILLVRSLAGVDLHSAAARRAAGRRYSRDWFWQFAPRIAAARAISAISARPAALAAAVERVPALLTVGATLSGKTRAAPEG